MLDDILIALRGRSDLQAWTVRHIVSRGVQLYAVPSGVEAQRSVANERYLVDVLKQTTGPDGAPACGSGNATLLPGDDIAKALDNAALMAGLVYNKPYTIPAPAPMPDVPLADPMLQQKAEAVLPELLGRLRAAVAGHAGVRLNAAEFFGEEQTIRLCNSRGIDARQVMTNVDAEWVLTSRAAEREVESFVECSRRRVADLDIEDLAARHARYTVDLLSAAPPQDYSGPVVLRGETLGGFVNGGVFQTLASGSAKFGKLSTWEIGQTVLPGPVAGDPLTVWATRRLPYGSHASRFDDEGLPGQRVELIRDGKLAAFTAGQRYADYLSIPATGAFGDSELPAGSTPAAALLSEPYVEVVAFSWFNPDEISGEFACEIRLGYVVEKGKRTPFKGGMLVGNVLNALADVRWSKETGFFGDYQGPVAARFAGLTVAA